MIHLLATFAFLFVTVGACTLIAATLMQEQDKIFMALGLRAEPARLAPRHLVRVRVAGRWQAASAMTARPWRAAA
jgi:hypothetical protein